jgi:hypothetical protein
VVPSADAQCDEQLRVRIRTSFEGEHSLDDRILQTATANRTTCFPLRGTFALRYNLCPTQIEMS